MSSVRGCVLWCVSEQAAQIKPLTNDTLSCRGKLLKRPVKINRAKSSWTVNARQESTLCINLSIHFYAVLSEALGGVEAGRSIVLQNSTKKSFKQQQSCQLPLAQIHVRHVPTAPVERDGSLNTCKRIRHAISYWMYEKQSSTITHQRLLLYALSG